MVSLFMLVRTGCPGKKSQVMLFYRELFVIFGVWKFFWRFPATPRTVCAHCYQLCVRYCDQRCDFIPYFASSPSSFCWTEFETLCLDNFGKCMSMILAVYVVNKQNSRANFYAGLLNFRRYSFPVNNDDKRQNPQKLLLHKGNKKYLKRTETENIYAVSLQPCPFQRFSAMNSSLSHCPHSKK